jgi:hypothetical protein
MTTATDSRPSEPVRTPRTAGEDLAAVTPGPSGDRAAAPGYKTTEAEIQDAVIAAIKDSSSFDLGPLVHELCRPLHWSPVELRGENYVDGLWVDLRPSEAEELANLVDAIYDQADSIHGEAVERIAKLVVAAGLQFAAEHPDAPRAKPAASAEDRGRPGLT